MKVKQWALYYFFLKFEQFLINAVLGLFCMFERKLLLLIWRFLYFVPNL